MVHDPINKFVSYLKFSQYGAFTLHSIQTYIILKAAKCRVAWENLPTFWRNKLPHFQGQRVSRASGVTFYRKVDKLLLD
jgi:hypothetical protein